MPPRSPALEKLRATIAREVRAQRAARGWTQGHLATLLGVAQSRLSDLERGVASFTAEQLVLTARGFNLPLSALVSPESDGADDTTAEIQNALARHGARHLLVDPAVVPTERYARPLELVVDVLADPRSDRWLAALGPVMVWSADRVPWTALWVRLSDAGVSRRVGWLAQNIAEAVPAADVEAKAWKVRAMRAHALATEFLILAPPPPPDAPLDPFGPGLRTPSAIERANGSGSPASARWRVVSTLHPAAFAENLVEASHAD